MDENTIRREVLACLGEVAPEVDPAGIEPGTSFRDQFDMDSVDFLNFMLSLEKRLGVAIPENDYPKYSSLDGCIGQLRPMVA